MIFTQQSLRQFYQQIKKLGRTELFRRYEGDKVFLLRHDVDFDIQAAHDMARLERKMGIVSTFFVMTTCHAYNILSPANRALLKEIRLMGHEIGLHFDPTLYINPTVDYVNREADILSFAGGCDVVSISLHNPALSGKFPLYDNYINAYDPGLFSDANYMSDSCFGFRNKNPYDFIHGIKDHMIQILLHPLHYAGPDYGTIVADSFMRHIQTVHKSFGCNNTYQAQVGREFPYMLKK